MAISMVVLIIAVLIIAIWTIFGLKRVKHKLFAILLIALILFAFFSFNMVFKGKDISINNVSDVEKITTLYYSWLGNVFTNIKLITTQAVKMNWDGNKTT